MAWKNWGGNVEAHPARTAMPRSEEEVSYVVKDAASKGQTVKAIGSGHSFPDIGATDGVMVKLDSYNDLIEIDRSAKTVKVQAGMTLASLNRRLNEAGLALPNLGDIEYQTVAGATSTATHGTGAKLGNLATQIAGLSLVSGDGSIVECSPSIEPGVFSAARVSLGALGILSTVTLQCVDAFVLQALERPMKLDEVLGELDGLVNKNEHFEFFWFPHTETTLTKTNNRTADPAKPRSSSSEWFQDIFFENYLFGVVCGLGKLRPSWIPGLNRFSVKMLGTSHRTDHSSAVFTSPRLVRFVEMEYAIPRAALPEALMAVKSMIDRSDMKISFPVEVRFVASDDIPLSTAYGRETGYIAVHVYRGKQFEPYFREVEAIMNAHEGRPHWGKMHYQTAESLRPRYPLWDEFQAVRRRLDPAGTFANEYTDRVLGPLNA